MRRGTKAAITGPEGHPEGPCAALASACRWLYKKGHFMAHSGPIPFIDLKRLVAHFRSEVLADWAACLDNTEFVGGPRVAAVEKKLASSLGVPIVVSCANGTDALLVALPAIGVKRGMKVALPNLTFWATFEAVAQLGAEIPVLVDIDPDDLHVSLDELRAAHDAHHFEALMLVHLFGWTSSGSSRFVHSARSATSPSSRTARSASASRRSASRSSRRPRSRRSRSTRPRWSAARWTAGPSPCSRRTTRPSSGRSATTVAPITTRTRTSGGTRAWAASRRRLPREAVHNSGDHAETGVAAHFTAHIEKQLHPYADAQQGRAGRHRAAQWRFEASFPQVGSHVPKCAYPRQYDPRHAGHALGPGHDFHGRPHRLQRLIDVAKVPHPVVDHGDPPLSIYSHRSSRIIDL